MTREEVKKLIPVLRAFAEGKDIQIEENDGTLTDVSCIMTDMGYNYRIKPQPKYRPFQSAEECWQEMLKHQPFGWMRDKTDGHYIQITTVANGKEHCTIGANFGWDFEGFFKNYTFADGEPFGVKEEGV